MEHNQMILSAQSNLAAVSSDDYLVSTMRREHNSRRMWLFFTVAALVSLAAFIAKA